MRALVANKLIGASILVQQSSSREQEVQKNNEPMSSPNKIFLNVIGSTQI